MVRPAEGGPRDDAGQGGGGDLADRVDELERRQAKVFDAVRLVAQSNGALASALQGLLAD